MIGPRARNLIVRKSILARRKSFSAAQIKHVGKILLPIIYR